MTIFNRIFLSLLLLLPTLPVTAAEEKPESFYRIKSLQSAHSTSVKDGGVLRIEQSLAACWREGDQLFLRLDAGLSTQGRGVNARRELTSSELLTFREDEGMAHYTITALEKDFVRLDYIHFIRDADGKPSELRYPMQLNYSPPLHVAVWEGRGEEVTRLLVADRQAIRQTDHRGRTALHLAAYRGDAALLSTLLKAGAEVDVPDAEKQTALMLSASHPETLKQLLTAGSNRTLQDAHGFDALSYAMPQPAAVTLLLEHWPEEQRQQAMQRAFVWGLVRGKPESLKLLLDAGLAADSRHLGRSLKDWAIYHKHAESLNWLKP